MRLLLFHPTTCTPHATWPLFRHFFSSSWAHFPLYSVLCSFHTLSLLMSLCFYLSKSKFCHPVSLHLSELLPPISPTTRPSLHPRIPATSVSNLVSRQLALNEGLWWGGGWKRRVRLGLRGGVSTWEWRMSALHEGCMFWKLEVHMKIEVLLFIMCKRYIRGEGCSQIR